MQESAQLLYQIWQAGELLSGSDELNLDLSQYQAGFQTLNIAGQRMRVFVLSLLYAPWLLPSRLLSGLN